MLIPGLIQRNNYDSKHDDVAINNNDQWENTHHRYVNTDGTFDFKWFTRNKHTHTHAQKKNCSVIAIILKQ